MKTKPTLALCMIVKNESAVIERCINSVKHLIDYAIIYDTGSTDDTQVKIAEALWEVCPFEIKHEKFQNFAHNRTLYMQAVKGKADYCIVLDADEVLIDDGFDKSELKLDSYTLGYIGNTDYRYPVIFRTTKPWRYEYVVHEVPVCDANHIQGHLETLKINHLHDGGVRHEKYERDIRLIKKELETDPMNSRYLFYLANSYWDIKDYRNAYEYYVRRVECQGWDQEVYISLYRAGMCCKYMDMFTAFVEFMEKAKNCLWMRQEAYYELGVYYNSIFDYRRAFENLSVGARLPYPKEPLFFYRPIYDYLLDIELAVTMYWIGDYEEAYRMNVLLESICDKAPANILSTVRANKEYCRIKLK